MKPAPLTTEQKLLCEKAFELAPLLSRVVGFRNSALERMEIFVDGETSSDFGPIAVLTESISYFDRNFFVQGPQMLKAVMDVAKRRKARIAELEAENARLRGEADPGTKQKSKAQWCAAACNKPLFRQWLADVHQVDISDRERVNTRVRSMLDVGSRSQLDEDSDAGKRWIKMWKDFKTWENAR